jgi:hypothetical protein
LSLAGVFARHFGIPPAIDPLLVVYFHPFERSTCAATMGSEREQQDDLSSSHANNNNNGGNKSNNDNNNVKVYVRLRPMDKLEMSRRSKDCIELDDVNPKIVTVDSPHHGVRDFSFDMVR